MVALAPALAHAQAAPADEKVNNDEIVVTGTLIRGVAPVGSQTLGVTAEAIQEKAANSTNELLASLPQVGQFNARPVEDPSARGLISINRVNLRNLPGFNSATGTVTLALVDGHRITPVGVTESSIDVDIIPAAVLERVDVVTDGGSSLYGADAVSGVINFVTMKKFEGLKLDANFGHSTTLSKYNQGDASLTAGKSWATGNAYISATYSARSNVLNGDTSWAKGDGTWNNHVFTPGGTQCLTPTGSINKWVYLNIPGVITGYTNNPAAGGSSTPVGTTCDQHAQQDYFPRNHRINIFGSVFQQVADNIEFRMTGYYTISKTTFADYPRGMTSAPVNPNTLGLDPNTNPSVTLPGGIGFSFGANPAYKPAYQITQWATWGFTPELKFDVGGHWQVRSLVHYGQSMNRTRNPGVNTLLAQSDIDAGLIDPLHVGTASASVISDVLNWETAQDTRHQLFDFRTIADGPLFALPGGDAKLAVGIEYQNDSTQTRVIAAPVGSINSQPYKGASQNQKSAFAEVSLPVLNVLELSGSVRYDNFSSFGGTTNPTLGAKLKPVDWLTIYGHWGKSYNAPTSLDLLASSQAILFVNNCATNGCINYKTTPNTVFHTGSPLLLTGTSNHLKPQTATTWAVGFDAKPIGGLNFGAEYYNIDFRNILGKTNPGNPQVYQLANPDLFIFAPALTGGIDPTTINFYLDQTANGTDVKNQIANSGTTIQEIVDFRITNVANAKLRGLDFHVNYAFPTSFGNMSFGISGNKQIKSALITGAGVSDLLAQGLIGTPPNFTATGNVGWSKDGWSARATVNYTGSYNTQDYTGAIVGVHPFVVTNLFLGYEFGDSAGALADTSLRLGIDNVFNRLPQVVEENGQPSSYRGWTLGRMLKVGFSKKF